MKNNEIKKSEKYKRDENVTPSRSKNMSKIRGKNTKPEIEIRKRLFSDKFRFRLHNKNLPGSPDLVLKKYNIVIFVNGCFWHCHAGCKNFKIPKTHTDFWSTKLKANANRDRQNIEKLLQQNWRVLVIWECGIRKGPDMNRIEEIIKSNIPYAEWPESPA